jgi:uncharacterized protein
MKKLTIIVLPGEYAICRLFATDEIPAWALQSSFYTVSKTPDELSVICEASMVPGSTKAEKGWCLLKIAAVLDLSLTGITAKFSSALAEAGINLCVVATYDTDYILIKEEKQTTAIQCLQNAGFTVQTSAYEL